MKEADIRKNLLEKIKEEVLELKVSPLYSYRKSSGYFPVIGEGNHLSKIMFIGEAPGKNEAKKGKPFCGRAGIILDELLDSINLPRSEVYVTNILKDRPPENRDPYPEEIKIYSPFLIRQIEIIKPEIIVTLGRFSMSYIFETFDLINFLEPISKMRGKVFQTRVPYGEIKIIPLYHPAVAIYNPTIKSELIKDFSVIKNEL